MVKRKMSINKMITEESRRGPTVKQRLAAGVLALALGFTAACGSMNTQYMQSERDASVDAAADVSSEAYDAGDAGPEDVRLPAGVAEPEIQPIQPAEEQTPQPAQEPEQAADGNGCLETRFNMHYNSTNFVDRDSPEDIADFIRTVVRQGNDTVYIAGFASVENRGDRINNDAPYNRWLATQRANRVFSIVRDVVRQEGLELTVNVTGAYAETDEFGAELADNRAVVLTTRALPDPDSYAEVAEQIKSHTPNSVYSVSCDVPEEPATQAYQAPTLRQQPRVARRHTPARQSVEQVIDNPIPLPGLMPALTAVYRQEAAIPAENPEHQEEAPAVQQPAQPQPVVTTDDGIPIYFGIDPLPPSRTVSPEGFIESGPEYVLPEPITPAAEQPPEVPQPAIPPSSMTGSDVTSRYDATPRIQVTDKDVLDIEQRVMRVSEYLADSTSSAPQTVDDALNNLYSSLRSLDDAAASFRSATLDERTSYLG